MKFLASLASLVLLLLSGISYGTTLRGISQIELIEQADLIVNVKPLAHSSHWRGGRIYTTYNVRVTEYLLGEGPGELNVELLGGEVDGIAQTVSGIPNLPLQIPKLLFLRKAPNRSAFIPLQLGLGIFSFDKEQRHWQPSAGDVRILGSSPGPVLLENLRQDISALRGSK